MDRLGSLNPNQFLVQSTIEVAEVIGIEPHPIKNGGMHVPDMKGITHSRSAQFIGLSMRDPTLDPPPGPVIPLAHSGGAYRPRWAMRVTIMLLIAHARVERFEKGLRFLIPVP